MNISESADESSCSSCKRQENGDSTTETDRPLKKARFAWQVKGKYHLKNEISLDKSSKSTPEGSVAGTFSENESECKKICSTVEPNLEILGNLFEQDLCTLDSVTKSDQQILPNRISEEKLPYPKPLSTENVDIIEYESNMNIRNELEDQCIASWQARQMTKCFLDNTINSLIDGWMRGPLLTDIDDDRFTVFGDPEPLEDNNDDSIENEGILMAISAHGLQNASASSEYSTDSTNTSNNDSKPFLSPPSSPQPEILDSSTSFRNDKVYVDDISKNTSQDDYAYSPCDSNKNEIGEDFDTINNNYSDNDNSHYDFLDTAVSFAIQYKGLTSYGTDYG
ncbi:uncharacterized protein LOC121734324 [Aricia agestis]|uniref:uncharacterized protein LOC121734324 n=1 Tax=Aricia agestis TaxID=91739 RepID=UPI001C20753F|nr:uncharacterized protein LOC121734324 [Aricia agestis]